MIPPKGDGVGERGVPRNSGEMRLLALICGRDGGTQAEMKGGNGEGS